MRFKIDENLPIEVSRLLVEAGHDSMTVHEQGLAGSPDSDLARVIRTEKRALITLDLDFSDIRTYQPNDYAGLIVLRPHSQDKKTVVTMADTVLRLLADETLENRLWIISDTRVRIHE